MDSSHPRLFYAGEKRKKALLKFLEVPYSKAFYDEKMQYEETLYEGKLLLVNLAINCFCENTRDSRFLPQHTWAEGGHLNMCKLLVEQV
jgi:hypothetical protein